MNRYQFEDLISEYIENELTISKRKLFESYLEDNPDAKDLVESVRINQEKMKSLPKVSSSSDFNTRLLAKIQKGAATLPQPEESQRTYFGFLPLHASLMTGLVIAFVFVSIQLFSPDETNSSSQNQLYANDQVPSLSNSGLDDVVQKIPDLVDVKEDSSLENNQKKGQKDFSKQMHFVND